MTLRRAFLLVALILLAAPAAGAARFDFYDRGPYRDGVPRPAQVLGYAPGTYHTSYGNMERYIDELQHAALDRVTRVPFGRSYEFRERALLVITSPANQRRLDAIREASARLGDPRLLAGDAEAEKLIRDTPVTVWLNYSIHGDESASFEAMMQVAYQLAAGEDSLTRAIRDRCVVILNLAHNPDGHERFVTWINALGSGNPDPLALEQQRQQPWGIGGRTNHYQIDLNRDALAMSQVESRQMGAAFRTWRPQVFVDHHGQTASYFFAPPSPPVNPDLSAAEVRKWTEIFGRANAAAFDRYGWNYYVRDVFDLYYPGYWDAWPSLQGAVGMTYETDGGGNLAIRRDDETVVTLLDGVERHFTASLATCAAAAANREARLRDFRRFALAAIDEGRRGEVRAYALDPGDDPLRAAELAEDLMATGVEVRWVAKPFRAGAARAVWADAAGGRGAAKAGGKGAPPARFGTREAMAGAPEAPWGAHEFARGAFVVDLAQPAGRLARTLIERDAPMDTAFARLQIEKYERNIRRGKRAPLEDYDFYDITAWSLPISYGVPAFALREAPAGVLLRTPRPEEAEVGSDEIPDSLQIGIPVTARRGEPAVYTLAGAKDGATALDLHGGIAGGRARTAYVWRSDREGAARLALRLLQEDFKVATATRPMRAGGREYPRGSFVARVERNPESLHERIAALARTSGVTVDAVNSAYTESGDTGVGSEAIASLKRPRLAVLVDHPVSPSSYGWLWFTLERRIGLRFTALRLDALASADLSRYNEIVIPDGDAGALAGALGDGGIAKLKDWVGRGGVLVCLDDAAEFPTLKSVGLSSARAVGVKPEKKDAKEEEEEEPKDAKADSIAREAERRPEYLPGTVFWVSLDPRHYLCYGYDAPRTPVLMQGRLVLRPSRDGANAAVFEREPLKLTGWSWAETARRMTGGAYAIDEPNGRGHVVMIAGPATFRLFWRSSERMVLNALLYAPAL
ncbi:MAG TPA: M14 family zinc carboxypeptidase [Candidatus Eisenbacteria bacterium]